MTKYQQNITPEGYWIVGTDTEIGKTIVSALFVTGLNASYWKPIQSGIIDGTDAQTVKLITDIPDNRIIPEVYKLNQPLSPHLSARLDDTEINLDQFYMPDSTLLPNNKIVIEAAGGLYVPLNDGKFMIDLVQKLALPAVLVCRSALGTINHSLMSIEILRKYDVPIAGFITNGIKNTENEKAITKYGKINYLGHISRLNEINSKTLQALWNELGLNDKLKNLTS